MRAWWAEREGNPVSWGVGGDKPGQGGQGTLERAKDCGRRALGAWHGWRGHTGAGSTHRGAGADSRAWGSTRGQREESRAIMGQKQQGRAG